MQARRKALVGCVVVGSRLTSLLDGEAIFIRPEELSNEEADPLGGED